MTCVTCSDYASLRIMMAAFPIRIRYPSQYMKKKPGSLINVHQCIEKELQICAAG